MTELIRDEERLTLPGIRLVVLDGPDRGKELVAHSGAVRIGTSEDNDLSLTDTSVSRWHAKLVLSTDKIRVQDQGSTNGTRIDGVRVLDAVVTTGSTIWVGKTPIRVIRVANPIEVPVSRRTSFGGLLGGSLEMRSVFAVLERVAPTESTVLIEGETGTGKGLAAEAIHNYSLRADGPFVSLDCSAISPTLVESELFGHVRGAFTGAVTDRLGVFEEAHGGTVFLDEIGELPLHVQPKLLRALERHEVSRVGESKFRQVDVRVIAATNRSLTAEVNRGNFREDLFFRLAVVVLQLPPLRTRRSDIPLLADHFVRAMAPHLEGSSEELLESLTGHSWPGNVRELRNTIERQLLMQGEMGASSPPPAQEAGFPQELLELPIKDAQERAAELFMRTYLINALQCSGGSVSGAARLVGTNRRYIQRLMRRYGIQADDTLTRLATG